MLSARQLGLLTGLLVTLSACNDSASVGPSPTVAAQVTTGGSDGAPRSTPAQSPAPPASQSSTARKVAPPFRHPLPGMPPVLHNDVYAATGADSVAARVAHDPAYLYVPDSQGSTTTVIDQRSHTVVRVIRSGELSQHVSPSYDLRTLYVDASAANQLVAINPRTAKVQRRIPVPRPYNVYFTPDGRQAIVMVEEHNDIKFVDPHTFKGRDTLHVRSCDGPNHADFSGNGRFFLVTCEFSGTVLKVSTLTHQVLGRLELGARSMPQDVRISPDATTFFVAEMNRDQVAMIDARRFRQVGAIKTPSMPHGLMPSRDGRFLYVTDRGAGKISVVSFARRRVVDTWVIPGGGSPDMGAVSANGRVLWVSGRYDGVVYGFNTTNGRLVARIDVRGSPHGLAVWPQPGRYSLGHTGNTR